MKRGYFVRPNAKWDHSLSARIGHPSLFDAPSVVLVNITNGARVTSEPDNLRDYPANLRGAQSPLRRLGQDQQVAATSVCQTRAVVVLRCS